MGLPAPQSGMGGVYAKVTPYCRCFLSLPSTPLQQILDVATEHILLHKIGERGTTFRTSLYADNAAIFVAPIKHDIQNLAAILDSFGEVTGLSTNFQKSSIVPIRCGHLNLEGILQSLPAMQTTFPIK